MRSGYSSRTLEIKSVPRFKLKNKISPGQKSENILQILGFCKRICKYLYYIQCLRRGAILLQKPASFQDNFDKAIQQRLKSKSNPRYPCLRQCLHQGNGTVESLASNPYQRAIHRSPIQIQSMGWWHRSGSVGLDRKISYGKVSNWRVDKLYYFLLQFWQACKVSNQRFCHSGNKPIKNNSIKRFFFATEE